MKNLKMVMLAALLMANVATADTEQRKLSREQKFRILLALRILNDEGVLQRNDDNQKVEVDQSVVEELISSGLLQIENSKMQAICIGAEK